MTELQESKKINPQLFERLKKLAPGTELRNGIELILHARTGGLIVIGDFEHVEPICDGGFEVSAPFSANILAELAKMDGAIILDDDISRVLRVNVHLMPDSSLHTSETGTRHRTAERVSRQTDALVIAISESKDLVSVYYRGYKYVLEDVRTLLSKANQALQTLERYRFRFDQESKRLFAVEFQGVSTLTEVISMIQRAEMLLQVAAEIERYIALLGSEGRLLRLQMEELMSGVDDEYRMLLLDYIQGKRKVEDVRKKIGNMSPEDLLDMPRVARALGYSSETGVLDEIVIPRGYRALRRIPRIPFSVIENIVAVFKDLNHILKASAAELDDVEGVGEIRAHSIFEGLQRLKQTSLQEISPV